MKTTAEETLDPFVADVLAVAAEALQVEVTTLRPLLKSAQDASKGDYALPCFPLAKQAKRSPQELAAEAAARVPAGGGNGLIARAEAAGPYLNFFLDPGVAAARVVGAVLCQGTAYGSSQAMQGTTIVIDYSSPNIAKHLAFHHIRSTMIGNALARILRFRGARVLGLNFLGDWGMGFAKLIVAMRRYGIGHEQLQQDAVTQLQDLYVRFNQEAQAEPQLEDEARAAFALMEQGDQELLKEWRFIRDVSLQEFEKLYSRLGVAFEDYRGEAEYDQASQEKVIQRLQAAGLTSTDEEGRLIVDLGAQGIKVPCILKKSDGASLYATRDLAAIFDRHDRYEFDQALYVVDMGQTLHFKQWFKVVELLGEPWASGLAHLPFGVVTNLEGGRLKTREGGAVLLSDVLDEAVARTRRIITESPRTELTDQADIDQAADWIGVGAVVFNDLKTARVKDVRFDLDEIVSIEGYTAPYIQYAHARIHGIFRKAGLTGPPADADCTNLVHERERALVRELNRFGVVIARAAREHEPSVIAAYLHDLATELSRFYHDCRVLSDDQPLMQARLSLIGAVAQVLANGLALLGIKAPERI